MAYLISTFPVWLLLALALGLAVGWITGSRGGGGGWGALFPWLAALAIGAVIAVARLLPGRAGLWFDLAMLMLAAYLAGCVLVCLLRRGAARPAEAPAGMSAPAMPASVMPVPSPASGPGPAAVPPREAAVEPAATGAGPAPAPAEALEQAITGLSAPRGGRPDPLTRIYGIDPETEARLNALGLYHFDQIASLTPAQRRWLFRQLGHAGRFPSWWWRWRFDAEQILAGRDPWTEAAVPVAAVPAAEQEGGSSAAPALEGTRPAGLPAPRTGGADDLKRIRGIGRQNEGRLHGLGIWHFDQIAAWSADEAKWIGGYLAFPGRIEREDWIGQARRLAAGAETEFSKRVDAGEVATSRDETGDDGQGNVIAPDPGPPAAPAGGRRGGGRPKPKG